jgi:hypothetical protein
MLTDVKLGNALILNSETGNDLATELNITDQQYAQSLTVFLVSFALFEVPSNIYLKKMTPSVRIPRTNIFKQFKLMFDV